MNSRCPKLAHGNNKKQNTEKSKQNREQKPVLKLRNQIISTRHEKIPKCENKQKQENNYFMRGSLKSPTNGRQMKQT